MSAGEANNRFTDSSGFEPIPSELDIALELIGCVPDYPHPGEACVRIGPIATPGQRVRLAETSDPHTDLRPGATGTVVNVDDADTVHVLWDSGQFLGLIAGEDRWETEA